MEKKTIYKIGAILIIIGFLIPVIATATESVPTAEVDKHSKETIQVDTNSLTATNSLHIQAIESELVRIESDDPESFGDHNMIGKWGLYDSFEDGEFIALKTGTEIFGRVSYGIGYQYFYMFLRPLLKTFNGVVLINDEFHSINGKYMTQQGKFTAMWEIGNQEGWFVGQLV
jgi:hypothetical protein